MRGPSYVPGHGGSMPQFATTALGSIKLSKWRCCRGPLEKDGLVANEMDDLCALNLAELPARLRPIFPVGYEKLKVTTWTDGRVLVYLDGGNRVFVLFE